MSADVFKMFGLPVPEPKTFAEWRALGYRISKGAKADRRNEGGEALFTIDQVWIPRKPSGSTGSPHDFVDDGDDASDYLGMDYSDFGNN